MDASLLEILKCPFCGTAMTLWDGNTAVQPGRDLEYGVLGCQCCAFPVVAGIPVIVVDDRARAAMQCLDQGNREDALVTMLGGDEEPARADAIRAMLGECEVGMLPDGRAWTWKKNRKGVRVLNAPKEPVTDWSLVMVSAHVPDVREGQEPPQPMR